MLNHMHMRLVWVPEDEPGIEDVRIAHDPAKGAGFSGAVVRLWEGQPLCVTYNLVCDTAWCARELQMTSESEAVGERTIRLFADGAGNWRDDTDQPLAALRGCIDVDIMLTPLTNTLPIRRLQLAPGESREISVVYIVAPDLSIRPFRQRYTRLDDADGGQRFRYESLEGGFTAVLPVDDDGFVVDYPGIWRRVWPTA
jgi:hypothetical protein